MTAHQPLPFLNAGMYGLDALQTGDRIKTPARMISAQDIDRFAALSGDRFAIHMDENYAIEAGFTGRVAHGLLVLSVIDGLKNQSDAQLDAIASLGWDISFTAPVIAGDTISVIITITHLRATSDNRRGIATLEVCASNQHGKIIQQGINRLMIKK